MALSSASSRRATSSGSLIIFSQPASRCITGNRRPTARTAIDRLSDGATVVARFTRATPFCPSQIGARRLHWRAAMNNSLLYALLLPFATLGPACGGSKEPAQSADDAEQAAQEATDKAEDAT